MLSPKNIFPQLIQSISSVMKNSGICCLNDDVICPLWVFRYPLAISSVFEDLIYWNKYHNLS